MNKSIIPSRPGQICKIVSDIPDLEAEEVYIVAEDPAGLDPEDELLVVSLKELKRNVKNPDMTVRESVRKDELIIVSENLETWVASWNKR